MANLSIEEAAQITREHTRLKVPVQGNLNRADICIKDNEEWPCKAIQRVMELEQLLTEGEQSA